MRKSRGRPGSRKLYRPERVFIDVRSLDDPLTRNVLAKLGGVPRNVIRNPAEKRAALAAILDAPDPMSAGKKVLWLTVQRGKFIKPCPCTPGYLGCNYVIINLNLQCPLDCSYCILQGYLSEPWITLHTNIKDLWSELDEFLGRRKGRTVRIGTGELGDSLALDHLTGLSTDFLSYFRRRPEVVFELKTKTLNIANLLEIDPPENVVVSWSLNAEAMAQAEENGAPSVAGRRKAARELAGRGYRLGFHFDPLIRHSGWKRGYAAVISALFENVPASRIAWISLGGLRFPRSLKKIIEERFPQTHVLRGEFVLGKDRKFRYFRPERNDMFKTVARLIKRTGEGADVPLYLCMESPELWRDVMGWTPKGKRSVEEALSLRR
jgi:spore photoproduct lyase